eukprot:1818170-Rhodomonas_salina.1
MVPEHARESRCGTEGFEPSSSSVGSVGQCISLDEGRTRNSEGVEPLRFVRLRRACASAPSTSAIHSGGRTEQSSARLNC